VLAALLWDVDGTLAETERDGHRLAFNDAFASMGIPWRWDETRYGQLLRVTGGRERILADLDNHADAPTSPIERQTLAAELHRRKNAAYAQRVATGAIALRPGVEEMLVTAAERGVRLAVVTTTSRDNLLALLRHVPRTRDLPQFEITICGEDVDNKKPHPEAYLKALSQLALAASSTLAIEDSPAGASAARAAQIPVIVTRSVYFSEVDFGNVLAIGPGLHMREGWQPAPQELSSAGGITLDDLCAWHRQASPYALSESAANPNRA
jgi:HAD superfamily hydrolase (TIGR01509 family)